MGERMAPRPGIDPLFTDDDVEEILDYLAYKDSLCPGCGQPRHESFSEDFEDMYVGEIEVCHSCVAKARAARHHGAKSGVYSYSTKREVTDG